MRLNYKEIIMGRRIGYARVSTLDQSLSMQIQELETAQCVKVFHDKVSGSKGDRPGLDKCLKSLKSGDTLVVWRLDRLGRSMQHLVSIVTKLKERDIAFKSLTDGDIDTSTASGELIFNIFSALAQFERELIRERTKAGLKAARARGKKGGRKPLSSDDTKVRMAKKMNEDKTLSVLDICSTLNISRATFYRYLSID
jgi:DNA invertase Pin-like site-specific DNA recombinase